jgi:hypothetical protein
VNASTTTIPHASWLDLDVAVLSRCSAGHCAVRALRWLCLCVWSLHSYRMGSATPLFCTEHIACTAAPGTRCSSSTVQTLAVEAREQGIFSGSVQGPIISGGPPLPLLSIGVVYGIATL